MRENIIGNVSLSHIVKNIYTTRSRGIRTLSLITLILSLTLAFTTPTVNATSVYDDVYQTTSQLVVGNDVGCTDTDITYAWDRYITDSTKWQSRDLSAIKTSYLNAQTNGHFGVSQFTVTNGSGTSIREKDVMVYWTEDTSLELLWWGNAFVDGISSTGSGYVVRIGCANNPYSYVNSSTNITIVTYDTLSGYSAPVSNDQLSTTPWSNVYHNYFVNAASLNYPSGYEGGDVRTGANIDDDDDGLSVLQEVMQGTSDGSDDTDEDGLSDLTESVWYPDHDAVFCDTSTPKNCAEPNPIKKDLYVEIDWTDDGTEEYKPTSTQLGMIEEKYADIGIVFHADTGQYGGGNELELPNYEATVDVRDDFYSYKWGYETENPANFDEDRYKIWHYMITGYNWTDGISGSDTSSGKAEPGGDDTFVSLGLLEDNPGDYLDFDDAIAGTMIHELGHNLCLTSTPYAGQDSSCLFSDIDNDDSPDADYRSAMNYDYQFNNTYSYSNGTNGVGDHDDIFAIGLGFNDFRNDDDSLVGGPS